MSRVYYWIAMLTVALWLPVTSHCYLEEAGLLTAALDECCASESDHAKAPVGDPCDTGCKMVEQSGFNFQKVETSFLPAFMTVTIMPPSPEPEAARCLRERWMWPPPGFYLVQFLSSPALSPRAPAFLA